MKTLRLFSHSLATLITVLSVPVALELTLAQPASAADVSTTPRATPLPLGQRAATPSAKDFYLDKTWQSPSGTTFTFLPGGKVMTAFNLKQGVRKWRAAGRIVEVSGGDLPGSQFFRFVSPTEAYYGGSKDQIFTPLTAK